MGYAILDKLLNGNLSEIEPIVKGMSDSDKQQYLDEIILKLKDKDANVRWRAAGALGMIRDAKAVEPLIHVLNDKDYVRNEAEKALENMGAEAVKPLIGALKDERPRVRSSVARILGRIRDDKSIDVLIETLKKERNPHVKVVIINTLNMMPLFQALKDGRWEWRTVDALVRESGMTEKDVRRILENCKKYIKKSSILDRSGNELYTLRSRYINKLTSGMTRGEANDIVNEIIHASRKVDEKYAKEHNLKLEDSLSTGRRQRARLLNLLEEHFFVEDS